MHRAAAVFASALLAASPAAAQPSPASPAESAADKAFQAQDWAAAAAAYGALAKSRPQDGQLHFRLGVSLHGLGRFGEAVSALEAAATLGAAPPMAQFRLAKALARAGRLPDARAALLRAAENGFYSFPMLDADADLAAVR